MELRDNGMCFACGPMNPIGLKLEFAFDNGRYVTRFTPQEEHQGYEGITHGGILSTLLDEVMARMVYALGHRAVTAEIRIRLRNPSPIGEELTVTGWIESENRRVFECASEARSLSGELVAEATAKILRV